MILPIALRFSFSSDLNHRGSSIRIAISLMFSLSVLMVAMSIMDFLQSGRFSGIRESISFDITISGDHEDEMRKMFPSATVFSYGETEALLDGNAYTLRYIDDSYNGGLTIWSGEEGGLIVPYEVLASRGYSSVILTAIGKGRSGMMLPISQSHMITGAYRLAGASGTPMLFLTLDSMPEGTAVYTAIKGADASCADTLRLEGYDAVSWKEKEESLYGAFLIERTMMIVMLSLLFIVILVSLRQSVMTQIEGKEKELRELETLGMPRIRIFLAALLSSWIVLAAGIAGGFVLSMILLEAASRFLFRFFLSTADLDMQYMLFFLFSAAMLAFSFLFTYLSVRRTWRKDIMEVLGE